MNRHITDNQPHSGVEGGARTALPGGGATRAPIIETVAGAIFESAIDLDKVRAAHVPLITEQSIVDYDGNTAAAYATCQMWRSVMFAGFPITPSTKWLETVATLISGKQKGTKFIKLMEAEHAVADYMAGAAGACRDLIVSTATSSVGLDHMTESTKSLGASGFGNAMLVNVYRATANYPLCIEGDPSDAFAHRDDGWIQICCRGVQQIYDTVVQAPCVGMHPEIMTPVMPGYYGIKDSHRSSRLVMEPDSAINAFQDKWIKPSQLPGLINGDTAMGNCVTSKFFQGFKINQRTRLERVLDILPLIGADFEKTFGRPGLQFVEKIVWPNDNDVDVAIVGMGPDMGTAAAVAGSEAEKLNLSVGVLSARLLSKAKVVLVLNQAHHYGPGHLGLGIAQACYDLKTRPSIVNCFAGMGGANVSDRTWREMIRHACRSATEGKLMERPTILHEGAVIWPS